MIFLRQAATDSNLQVGVVLLLWNQLTQSAVQLVVGILANGAGIEHDEVGVIPLSLRVTGSFEQTGDSLTIVNIHLAAEGANLIGQSCHDLGILPFACNSLQCAECD